MCLLFISLFVINISCVSAVTTDINAPTVNNLVFEQKENLKINVQKKGNISGAVIVKGSDVAILYQEQTPLIRRRATVAHELAHCCLHMELNERIHFNYKYDKFFQAEKEIEISEFMSELLVPEEILKQIICKTKVITQLEFLLLTSAFMVSKNMLESRLSALGITVF